MKKIWIEIWDDARNRSVNVDMTSVEAFSCEREDKDKHVINFYMSSENIIAVVLNEERMKYFMTTIRTIIPDEIRGVS